MGKEDQGIDRKRYSVIPRTLILLFNEDQVLLLKGSTSKHRWAGKYNGLGGHVERGEDILSSARRELQEESGIANVSLHLCGTIICDVDEYLGVSIFVYKGYIGNEPLCASDEGTLEWIPVDQVQHLNIVEDMIMIIPRVHEWGIGDEPFSATNAYDEEERLVTRFF